MNNQLMNTKLQEGRQLYLPVTVKEAMGNIAKVIPDDIFKNWTYVKTEKLVDESDLASLDKSKSISSCAKAEVIEVLGKVRRALIHFRNEGNTDLRDAINAVNFLEDVYNGKVKESDWNIFTTNED